MDSAGSDPLRSALVQQGVLLGQHATQLNTTAHEVDALNARVAELLTRVDDLQREAANRVPSSALAFPWSPNLMPTILRFTMAILMPAKPFSPSVHWCFHCSLDVTPRKRLRWHMSSLFSPAVPANGESPYGDRGLPAVLLLWLFARKWRSSSTDQLREMRRRLSYLGCPRERGSVTDYAIQFQTLAAACGWNEGARARFLEGLDYAIADELAAVDLPRELDSLINLALRVEGRLNRRRQRRQANTLWRHLESSSDTTSPQSADVEPMQLGRLRLTVQQRQERLAQGLCLYCGKAGHFVLQCPLKVKAHQWSGESWWAPSPVQTLQLCTLNCPFDSPSREVLTLATPFWIQGLRGISWILLPLTNGTFRPFPWPNPLLRGH